MSVVNPENQVIFLTVPGGKKPERIDIYITHCIENATRNKVQNGISDGSILVNGKPTKASYKVAPFDEIKITLPHPPPPKAEPEAIDIDIIYEDDFLLIVNKKAGMVVHPAFSNYTGTLVNALLHHIKKLSTFHDDPIRPGLVHRIDKDTSGLLLIAKNEDLHAKLAKDFARHAIEREYIAITVGKPKQTKGTIASFLTRDVKNRKRFMVSDKEGKWAVSHYEIIEEFENFTLVKMKLETGRTHQIRVHLSSIGLPILGDAVYGGTVNHPTIQTPKQKMLFAHLLKLMTRQALHAKTLGFYHYGLNHHVSFDSNLPDDFIEVLNLLRLRKKENLV